MSEQVEEWVRRRAYALWEAEGRPAGRSHIHWRQAEEEASRQGFFGLTEEGMPVPPPRRRTQCEAERTMAA